MPRRVFDWRGGGVLLVCLAGSVVGWGRTAAGQGPASRAERLTFDEGRGQWEDIPAPEPGTAGGDLAIAKQQFADRDYRTARRALDAWTKKYGKDDVHYAEALLLRARVEKALGEYDAAYELLEEFLNSYSVTDLAPEAALDLFNVSEVYLSGVKRKFLGMPLLSGEERGLDTLDRIATDFPKVVLAEQAVKTKGDYHFRQGDFLLAELEYTRLLTSFPGTRYRRYALRRSADSAQAGFGGVQFDDAPLIEAEERYRLYIQQYPGVAEQEGIGLILSGIREKRAAKELEIAKYYQRTKHPQAAAFYLRSVLRHWPDTIAATQAAGLLTSIAPADGGGEAASAPAHTPPPQPSEKDEQP